MSERYLVTGAQLGTLLALEKREQRQKIIDEIIDKQFIGNSDTNIVDDARSIANMWKI